MRWSSLPTWIIFATLISPFAAKAQRGLVEKLIPELTDSYRVTLTLVFDPGLARMHKPTPAEKADEELDGVNITYPLELKLNRSGPYFVVRCTSGGSDDFSCAFIALGDTFDYKTNDVPGLR